MKVYEEINKVCKYMLKDFDWAQDISQEVYLECFERGVLDIPYVKVIAKYRCIDLINESKNIESLEELPESKHPVTSSLEEQVMAREERRMIEGLTSSGTYRQNEVAKLAIKGYSTKEISEELQITVHNVNRRLNRICDNFRRLKNEF